MVCTLFASVVYCTQNNRKRRTDMYAFEDIELFDCPLCQGPGLIQEENGWCLYVECLDCGCHTAELRYGNEEERQAAARQAASTWNVGKVIHSGTGD